MSIVNAAVTQNDVVYACVNRLFGFMAKVFNGIGQKVDAFPVDGSRCKMATYTMPDVPNGMYYLVLKSEKKTGIRKVLLQR